MLKRSSDEDHRVSGAINLGNMIEVIAREIAAKLELTLSRTLKTATAIHPMLLTVKDAAVYLGRSEQSVQHLILRRELPVVRVGRRVHLDRRDLDAFIERHKY